MGAGDYQYSLFGASSSLLAMNFNISWAEALRYYEQGAVTHFAMLHADAAPENGWLGVLVQEMQEHGAQFISATMAIKNNQLETSTALSLHDDDWEVKRFTLHDLVDMPGTFSIDDLDHEPGQLLLGNTGCMLVELGPWCLETDEHNDLKVFFTINDRIRRGPDGSLKTLCQPEDWNFSRMVAAAGKKVCVTQKIHVDHYGECSYPNRLPPGAVKQDRVVEELSV